MLSIVTSSMRLSPSGSSVRINQNAWGFSLTYKLIFKAFLIGLVFRFTHVTTSIHCSSNNFLKLYKSDGLVIFVKIVIKCWQRKRNFNIAVSSMFSANRLVTQSVKDLFSQPASHSTSYVVFTSVIHHSASQSKSQSTANQLASVSITQSVIETIIWPAQ